MYFQKLQSKCRQGSDTRAHTQKTEKNGVLGFFLGKATLKNPAKKPGPTQSNFDVIFHSNKEIF